MKKLFFLLTFFFLINNCFAEEFVNPVFNKTLYAYSRGSWNTLLTPNSITEYPSDSSVSDIYTQKHSCKLLENEFDHIKYNCTLCYKFFFEEKERSFEEKIIFFRITDNGLIEEQSFKPHSLEYYNLQYYTTTP